MAAVGLVSTKLPRNLTTAVGAPATKTYNYGGEWTQQRNGGWMDTMVPHRKELLHLFYIFDGLFITQIVHFSFDLRNFTYDIQHFNPSSLCVFSSLNGPFISFSFTFILFYCLRRTRVP